MSKKRNKKNLLSIVLALTMIICIVPLGVLAEESVTEGVLINEEFLAKYNKLQVIKKDDLKKIKFSDEINEKLDRIVTDLDKASLEKDTKLLEKVITEVLYLHQVTDQEVKTLHDESDQFDYILFNSINLMLELTEDNKELRNKMLVKLSDDMYASTANKFNSFKSGRLGFLNPYAEYLYKTIGKSYIKDVRTQDILLYSFCMLNNIYHVIGGQSESTPGQAKSFFNPKEGPSFIKPDKVRDPGDPEDQEEPEKEEPKKEEPKKDTNTNQIVKTGIDKGISEVIIDTDGVITTKKLDKAKLDIMLNKINDKETNKLECLASAEISSSKNLDGTKTEITLKLVDVDVSKYDMSNVIVAHEYVAGEIEKLKGIWNAKDNTVTFVTEKGLSPFAVFASLKALKVDDNTPKIDNITPKADDTTPKTGDNTPMIPYAVVLISSLAIIVVSNKKRKLKKHK